jgi:hypothetical protein
MIRDYEKYHGIVLRALVAESSQPLTIAVDDIHGRINGYVVNQRVAIYIKHSSKRLTPWRFGFSSDHIGELNYLKGKYKSLYVVLICGIDGFACLSYPKLLEIAADAPNEPLSIGLARSRNQMYGVYGAKRMLDRKVAIGVRAILDDLGVASVVREPEVAEPVVSAT